MKIIDTSKINPSAGYPGLANVNSVSIGNGGAPDLMQGLDFLQQANKDNANALALSVVSNTTKVTILSGCNIIGAITIPETYNIASGWAYYNGEIFQVQGANMGSAPSLMPYLSATINNSPTDVAIPTTLSDGSTVSMHNQRIITFAWSLIPHTTGGTTYLPDYTTPWISTEVAQNTASITTLNGDITSINTRIATLNASITNIDPLGTIKMFGGSTSGLFDSTGLGLSAWAGWALCNGQNTTPNLRGQFIVGFDDSGVLADYDHIGNTGGAATVTLNVSEMPSHTHTLNIEGYAGTTSSNNGDGEIQQGSNTGLTTASTGGGGAHENRPPYYTLAYVMRVS